jgi:hypothetical protein
MPWSQAKPPGSDPELRPMKVEDRARILKAVATGRTWLDELLSGEITSTEALAARERCRTRLLRPPVFTLESGSHAKCSDLR